MVLDTLADLETQHTPLKMFASSDPIFAPCEALIKVKRCGVWHAELDEIEGRTPHPRLPVVLGNQFVHPIPDSISDSEAVPLLYAGAIGYRALKLSNLHDGQNLNSAMGETASLGLGSQ